MQEKNKKLQIIIRIITEIKMENISNYDHVMLSAYLKCSEMPTKNLHHELCKEAKKYFNNPTIFKASLKSALSDLDEEILPVLTKHFQEHFHYLNWIDTRNDRLINFIMLSIESRFIASTSASDSLLITLRQCYIMMQNDRLSANKKSINQNRKTIINTTFERIRIMGESSESISSQLLKEWNENIKEEKYSWLKRANKKQCKWALKYLHKLQKRNKFKFQVDIENIIYLKTLDEYSTFILLIDTSNETNNEKINTLKKAERCWNQYKYDQKKRKEKTLIQPNDLKTELNFVIDRTTLNKVHKLAKVQEISPKTLLTRIINDAYKNEYIPKKTVQNNKATGETVTDSV